MKRSRNKTTGLGEINSMKKPKTRKGQRMVEVMNATGFCRNLAGIICKLAPSSRRFLFCKHCLVRIHYNVGYCDSCYRKLANDRHYDMTPYFCHVDEHPECRSSYCKQRVFRFAAYLRATYDCDLMTFDQVEERKRNNVLQTRRKTTNIYVICCSFCLTICKVVDINLAVSSSLRECLLSHRQNMKHISLQFEEYQERYKQMEFPTPCWK